MTVEPHLVAESMNDALIDCVKSCGGSKVVGAALWPAKTVDAAQRHLLSCLNPERPEKLDTDEIESIARMARERGCHALMGYLAQTLSYAEPVPVEPKDEADDLRRKFLDAAQALSNLAARIENLDAAARVLRAA